VHVHALHTNDVCTCSWTGRMGRVEGDGEKGDGEKGVGEGGDGEKGDGERGPRERDGERAQKLNVI
jgi:hypothetical protein